MRRNLCRLICVLGLAAVPLGAGAGSSPTAAAGWIAPIPATHRASLLAVLHRLLTAESRQDWQTVYRLRPRLDRDTESEEQFAQRWQKVTRGTVLDFEPRRARESLFVAVKEGEKVFDIQGCAEVERDDAKAGQQGAISAHLDQGSWYLTGVHLMTDNRGKPEPCTFHAGHGLLTPPPQRH